MIKYGGVTINKTTYNFLGQKSFYKGKVRDIYNINNSLLVMITTDRLSAFDVIMPKQIPFKGQVLNQISTKMLKATEDIVPNWLLATPDPNVTIGYLCDTFKIEMVIRGYITGHAWREYKKGKKVLCGVTLPEGMIENKKLKKPIITPSTKATVGDSDEDISKEDIIKKRIVTEEEYQKLETYTHALFKRGTEIACKQGLILVDAKYEFGKTVDGKIVVVDEIHTPDSARYFYANNYEEIQRKNGKQKQLSKEFVREWLMENNYEGKEGQKIPKMTKSKIEEISNRYIELYEQVTGEKFIKTPIDNIETRIEKNVNDYLKTIFS